MMQAEPDIPQQDSNMVAEQQPLQPEEVPQVAPRILPMLFPPNHYREANK